MKPLQKEGREHFITTLLSATLKGAAPPTLGSPQPLHSSRQTCTRIKSGSKWTPSERDDGLALTNFGNKQDECLGWMRPTWGRLCSELFGWWR